MCVSAYKTQPNFNEHKDQKSGILIFFYSTFVFFVARKEGETLSTYELLNQVKS